MSATVFGVLFYLSVSLFIFLETKLSRLVLDTTEFIFCTSDLKIHTWSESFVANRTSNVHNEVCFVTKVCVDPINSVNLMISSAYPNLCTVTINLTRQESNQRLASPSHPNKRSKEWRKKCLNKNVSCFICIDLCILCVGCGLN